MTDTDSDFNTYFSTADAEWGRSFVEWYQSTGFELNSNSDDPRFYDAGQHDFRMRPGSLAAATGFAQLDPATPGLKADFSYAEATDPLDRLFVRSGEQFSHIRMASTASNQLKVSGRTTTGYAADLGSADIRYTSDHADIANVDASGHVTAVAEGMAEISVTATLNGAVAETSIVVIVGTDTSALSTLTEHAADIVAGAVAGTGPGEYPRGAIDRLATRVDAAQTILADDTATQRRVDAETDVLREALALFNGKVNVGCETVLPEGRIAYDDGGNRCAASIEYVGQWRAEPWDGAYNRTRHYSNVAGDYVELTFDGTGVGLMTQLRPGHGIAAVSIDGGSVTNVDTYSAAAQDRVLRWQKVGLSPGEHTVRIEVTGDANPAASNSWVAIDAIVVTP